jgi:predicted O-linked N-acetylglucosamine transferase (SPINDLY family)
MAGSHYVSRMSTAVLSGAGMDEWIAVDAAAYIALAQLHAAALKELRANRQQWRMRLQASPLGDAADLMFHLEQAFSAMHTEKISSF